MKNRVKRGDFIKMLAAGVGTTVAANMAISCGKAGGKASTAQGEVPKGEMTKKGVHGVGKDVALLGYGGTRLPMLDNPKAGESPVDQEAFNELIDKALELGVNYFDTAPPYVQGWSESALGEALSRHPRESYFVATKMSNQSFKEITLENSKQMYNDSFKNLRVDYIDYYLMHSVGSEGAFKRRFVDNGVIDFLVEERKAGRIKHLGFSFHGSHEGLDYMLSQHEKYHWDFVLIQLNYADWRHNLNVEYIYNELEKRNIAVKVMQSLQGGRLVNVPNFVAAKLKEQSPNNSIASWAFRFAGSRPMVFCVLSGMLHLEHIEDNVRTYSPLVPLTKEQDEFLFEVAQILSTQFPSIPCNDCDYCMPCPYGIDIPNIFGHYNKCINEGNVPQSAKDENFAKARRAYLVSYDRTVERLRQADRCIGCDECVKHCPQKIKIPRELRRVNEYIEKLKQESL